MSWAQRQQLTREALQSVLEIGRAEIGHLKPDTMAKLDRELAEVNAFFAAVGVPMTADTRRAFLLGMCRANDEFITPKHVALAPCLKGHSVLLLGIATGIHDGGR